MKILLVFLIAFSILPFSAFPQTESRIKEVEKLRSEIKSNRHLLTKTVAFNDTSGYKYVFKQDSVLKLVMINYRDTRDGGRFMDKKIEWYFENEKLLFCEQEWIDINSGELVENQKCYFSKGQMVAWIKTDKKWVDPASKEFIDMAGSLVTYGQKLIVEAKIFYK